MQRAVDSRYCRARFVAFHLQLPEAFALAAEQVFVTCASKTRPCDANSCSRVDCVIDRGNPRTNMVNIFLHSLRKRGMPSIPR